MIFLTLHVVMYHLLQACSWMIMKWLWVCNLIYLVIGVIYPPLLLTDKESKDATRLYYVNNCTFLKIPLSQSNHHSIQSF